MKRLWILSSLTLLLIATGCGASSSSSRYITTEQSAEPSESASAPEARIEAQESPSPTTQVEPPQQTDQAADFTKKDEKEPSRKPAMPADKAEEAENNNVAVGEAVTDSIMDNVKDEDAPAESPKAAQLKEPIEHIRSLVKDLKQHAENDDSALMKEVAASILKDWEAMKADVSSSVPDMADFLEEKMTKLSELAKSETIDSQAILQIDYELYQSFRQLADKAGF